MEAENQSQLVNSSALMNSLLDRFGSIDERIEWVNCPACREEWSKLTPCQVWGDQSGSDKPPHFEYLCAECAESLKSLPWIVHQWPQRVFDNYPKPRVETAWMKKQPMFLMSGGEKVFQWKNQIGKIWLANVRSENPEYLIRFESNRLVVYVAGSDEPLYSSNAIDAWFKIIRKLKKPGDDQ